MPYYLVNLIVTGVPPSTKTKPDVDPGVGFVCAYGSNVKAVVLTTDPLIPRDDREFLFTEQDVKDACTAWEIPYDDVLNMYIQGG